jgi:hypothetical protein
MVETFNRAGENALQSGLSFDFRGVGIPGLTLNSLVAVGNGAVAADSKEPISNFTETDLTLDYRPEETILKGFWFRIRQAFVDNDGGRGTTKDSRLQVMYDIPLWSGSAT